MPSSRYAEVVTSPVGKDKLLLEHMTSSEVLGRPFHFQLDLVSKDHDVSPDSVLGQAFAIRVETPDSHERHFHGIATHFAHVGLHRNYSRYRLTLRPWLWLLSLTSDCRIFQEKTVPDIVKQVFRDAGFTDFKDSLSGSYPERNYCVQYRESDFAFVSRLMEHEGIYYYFEHSASKHTLVLSDGYGAHSKAAGYATVPYYPPDEHKRRKDEHLHEVSASQHVQPGKYKVESFDFVKPKADLQGTSTASRSHNHSSYEMYDYPGDYAESGDGNQYAKVRLEEYQAHYEVVAAAGSACGLGTGNLFTLEDHPRDSLNREYLIIDSTHEVSVNPYESEAGGPEESQALSLQAIDSSQQFRCGKITPAPVIYGPQTAIVVGKQGEEIWTDEHGRVKVQFHWDREGTNDENSSCWIRVAQIWAGKTWGAVMLPRIGQEVIVEFLNGDPDQPIVTGRVYNGDNKTPYSLPANQTQSGIKSRSTKNGTGDTFNELRFEDKQGEEQVYFHAQKDFERFVENDDKLTVDEGSQTIDINQGDRTTTLGQGSDTLSIKQGDRTATLDMGDDALTLKMGNMTTKLDLGKSDTEAMQSIELKVGQSSVKLDQMGVTIKGMMVTIEGTMKSDLKGMMTTVNGSAMLKAGGGVTMIG